jgi:nuclear pore complex protein Nup205
MCLDTPALLAFYESLLALLQLLSQSKNGAVVVLKSGLFESVRESQLFSADPDIGIG